MKKISILSFVVFFLFAVNLCAQEAGRGRPQREPNTLSEREKEAKFELLFDGKKVDEEIWQDGAAEKYKVEDGTMICDPGGTILTKKEYKDFVFRFEFKLPPKGNNGVGIRAGGNGDAAYNGFEVQILDDEHEVYKTIAEWQAHGSVYRFVPAKRGSLRPTGEWNREEIIVFGNKIKVVCNGQTIVDADVSEYVNGEKEAMDGKPHKFNEKGFVGFLGHGDPVAFRSVRIKELADEKEYEQFKNPPQRRPRGGNR